MIRTWLCCALGFLGLAVVSALIAVIDDDECKPSSILSLVCFVSAGVALAVA
jgi:hypothetical protein